MCLFQLHVYNFPFTVITSLAQKNHLVFLETQKAEFSHHRKRLSIVRERKQQAQNELLGNVFQWNCVL